MVIIAKENVVAAWVFLIGVVLAIIIGIGASSILSIPALISHSGEIYAILVILGLGVGFSINVSRKDSQTFLIASAVLVMISKFGMESVTGSLIGIGIGDLVSSTFGALTILFIPATMVVIFKTVFGMIRI